MDDIIELQRRKIMLLGNNNLSDSIKNMIKVKRLPAELDSMTLIAGREGKTEIVVRLYINILDKRKELMQHYKNNAKKKLIKNQDYIKEEK